jgi:hypothetical protein
LEKTSSEKQWERGCEVPTAFPNKGFYLPPQIRPPAKPVKKKEDRERQRQRQLAINQQEIYRFNKKYMKDLPEPLKDAFLRRKYAATNL